jgi:ABC-type Zn uptake system ZnuABC Zn-binding protein ZnuA
MIPLRAVSEAFHASVDWDREIENGRTLVPLRFVAEIMGMDVDWDKQTKTVTINSGYVMDESKRYMVDTKTGILYSVSPDKEFSRVAEGIELVTENGATKIRAEQTANQNMLITITNNFGEPQINYRQITLYMNQNAVKYRTAVKYFNRFAVNVTHHEHRVILTDGNRLCF